MPPLEKIGRRAVIGSGFRVQKSEVPGLGFQGSGFPLIAIRIPY